MLEETWHNWSGRRSHVFSVCVHELIKKTIIRRLLAALLGAHLSVLCWAKLRNFREVLFTHVNYCPSGGLLYVCRSLMDWGCKHVHLHHFRKPLREEREHVPLLSRLPPPEDPKTHQHTPWLEQGPLRVSRCNEATEFTVRSGGRDTRHYSTGDLGTPSPVLIHQCSEITTHFNTLGLRV